MNRDSNLFKELTDIELNKILINYFGFDIKFEANLISGGLFNTTYFIKILNTNEKFILRVGPVNQNLLLPFELNLMKGEEYVYSLCESYNIPSSNILKCDVSKNIISRDYMIIKYIDSKPFCELQFNKKTESSLFSETGKYINKLHQIKAKKFGRVYDVFNEKGFNFWSDFIFDEFQKLRIRLNEYNIFTEEDLNKIEHAINKNSTILNEITEPHLAHCDLWTGNILIESYDSEHPKVAAIIDIDRALFGDIDFDFANPWIINEAFLKGYGTKLSSSPNDITRKNIYRLMYHLLDSYVWRVQYNNPTASEIEKNKALVLINDLI